MMNKLFYQSRIVKGNSSFKEPRAHSIATSRGSPAELDVFRVLPQSPKMCVWCYLWNEYFGKLEIYRIILINPIINEWLRWLRKFKRRLKQFIDWYLLLTVKPSNFILTSVGGRLPTKKNRLWLDINKWWSLFIPSWGTGIWKEWPWLFYHLTLKQFVYVCY